MESLEIRSERDLALARNVVKKYCVQIKLSIISTTKFVTAVSEIGRNMLNYAEGGELEVSVENQPKPKITCVFTDEGPGIDNLEEAMSDGYSSKNSMGKGLPGAKRICNYFDIESETGKGSKVTISQW